MARRLRQVEGNERAPKRGEIYSVNFAAAGGSLKKTRPAVIVQNDMGNEFAPHTIVAALRDAKGKSPLPVFVRLPCGVAGLTKDSIVDCAQLATVTREQLGHRWGSLPNQWMTAVDRALVASLGISLQ